MTFNDYLKIFIENDFPLFLQKYLYTDTMKMASILIGSSINKSNNSSSSSIVISLLLSNIAALQAPVIMMSQNREAKRVSLRSKNDYRTDLKSELISSFKSRISLALVQI